MVPIGKGIYLLRKDNASAIEDLAPEVSSGMDFNDIVKAFEVYGAKVQGLRQFENHLHEIGVITSKFVNTIQSSTYIEMLPRALKEALTSIPSDFLSKEMKTALLEFTPESYQKIQEVITRDGKITLHQLFSILAEQISCLVDVKFSYISKFAVINLLNTFYKEIKVYYDPKELYFKDFTQEA